MKEEKDVKDNGHAKSVLVACVAMAKAFANLFNDTEMVFRSVAVAGKGLRDAMTLMILQGKDTLLLQQFCAKKGLVFSQLSIKVKLKIAQSFGFWLYCKKDAVLKFFKNSKKNKKSNAVTWKKEVINGRTYNAGYNKDGERIFLEVL